MATLFIYTLKMALCLALFYLFYTLLMSHDTLHRFNRIALLVILAVSALLPFIQFRFSNVPTASAEMTMGELTAELLPADVQTASPTFPWGALWLGLYLAGVLFFLFRTLASLYQIHQLIAKSEQRTEADNTHLVLHDKAYGPFSWMHYIVLSHKDWQENGPVILAHEKAHIALHHSWDLLLAQLCIILQWFNPAAWLLKKELQAVHEFEADAAVIRNGYNLKQYQLLIIEKTIGARLYSVANQFNNCSTKKRIIMMSKKQTNPWARLKLLYVLPLSAMATVALATPQVSEPLNQLSEVNLVALLPQTEEPAVEPTVITPEEVKDNAAAQEVKKAEGDDDPIFMVAETMPEFPGGTEALMKFISQNIKYPVEAQKANQQGRVIVSFVVDKDGTITDPQVIKGVNESLDAEAVRVLMAMPKWTPGTQRGKAVKVKYTAPIAFRLKDTKAEKSEKQDTVKDAITVVGYSSEKDSSEEPTFMVVEEMPEFPGGQSELFKFLQQTVKYPMEAQKKGIAGRVMVNFVVDKDGSLDDVSIAKSVHPLLDAEAIRVIKAMPNWKPGKQRGKAVRTKYTVPIQFRLGQKESTK